MQTSCGEQKKKKKKWRITKQGVPWLEIVLRENERKMLSFVEKWKVKKKQKQWK